MPHRSDQPQHTAVLAVDDTPANLLAFRAIIEPLGVEAVTAKSGQEALDRCAERAFAVVMLDVFMPGLDAFETLKRLRQLPNAERTPVMFITADDLERSQVRHAYSLGAVDVLIKPIDADILRAKLGTFIALHEQAATIRDLASALATKDRHIGVLAHDLRNPLSIITMTASVLSARAKEGERAMVDRLSRAAVRMDRLVGDMLDFALAAAQRLRTNPTRADLSKLCEELASDFEATYPDVRFTCNVPKATMGSWDVARVEQAVANLLGNAAKYGNGAVALKVEATKDTVRICVENGGAPIDPNVLGALFEPFERGTNIGRGVGLGLYIVREIARAHGGEVEATSADGVTRFSISLPRETS